MIALGNIFAGQELTYDYGIRLEAWTKKRNRKLSSADTGDGVKGGEDCSWKEDILPQEEDVEMLPSREDDMQAPDSAEVCTEDGQISSDGGEDCRTEKEDSVQILPQEVDVEVVSLKLDYIEICQPSNEIISGALCLTVHLAQSRR